MDRLCLGDFAPNFKEQSSVGLINLYKYLGENWGILVSHPADFTPVCTTELASIARLSDEFSKRKVKILAVSVDTVESHLQWISDINSILQGHSINFPIISDVNKKICKLYGMIHENSSSTVSVRSVFIIDPKKKIRLMIDYPISTGRNFPEILRVIDSLQLIDNYDVFTPANWKRGDDVIISPFPIQKDNKVQKNSQCSNVLPYLRMIPQPNNIDGE